MAIFGIICYWCIGIPLVASTLVEIYDKKCISVKNICFLIFGLPFTIISLLVIAIVKLFEKVNNSKIFNKIIFRKGK